MAMGFLEVAGYGVAVYAMNKACKAVDIEILGIDTINPKDSSAHIPLTVQVKFEGSISDVRIATEIAKEAALQFNSKNEVITSVIDNPYDGTKKLGQISKVKFE
jgi:microcompartment protein CcmL/EutN